MRSLLLSAVRAIALCGCLTLATSPQVVLAQGAGIEEREERKEPAWIPAYFLTLLGIGIGMLCICRPSGRVTPDGEKEDRPA